MEKDHHINAPDRRTIRKFDALIQDRVNSGFEMPTGWVFKGLTILFHHKSPNHNRNPDNTNTDNDPLPCRLKLASNTARFAGAHVPTSTTQGSPSSSVTHIVVDSNCPSTEISSIRGYWSAMPGTKIPHLVSVDWVEESWRQRTLLDEESKSHYRYSRFALLLFREVKDFSNFVFPSLGFLPRT